MWYLKDVQERKEVADGSIIRLLYVDGTADEHLQIVLVIQSAMLARGRMGR